MGDYRDTMATKAIDSIYLNEQKTSAPVGAFLNNNKNGSKWLKDITDCNESNIKSFQALVIENQDLLKLSSFKTG